MTFLLFLYTEHHHISATLTFRKPYRITPAPSCDALAVKLSLLDEALHDPRDIKRHRLVVSILRHHTNLVAYWQRYATAPRFSTSRPRAPLALSSQSNTFNSFQFTQARNLLPFLFLRNPHPLRPIPLRCLRRKLDSNAQTMQLYSGE